MQKKVLASCVNRLFGKVFLFQLLYFSRLSSFLFIALMESGRFTNYAPLI